MRSGYAGGHEPLLFEISSPGKRAYSLPVLDVAGLPVDNLIPRELQRQDDAGLPEVSEVELVRHFTNLSRKNHAVDTGFYPLGSCTMKYNPRINEDVARLPGLAQAHPQMPATAVQGCLRLLHDTERFLCELTGMDHMTFQPAAGAHGELLGILLIKAYHTARGEHQRRQVLVPDSAHGTNPATAAMVGYEVVTVPSDSRGNMDLAAVERSVGPETAALMATNPSTLGLFDENILSVAAVVHRAGGLLYYDGANLNAVMGYSRPGDMGFDVVHLNLHKTFSTPHGGGGPGAGPVGVKAALAPYLPVPLVSKGPAGFTLDYDRPESIGKVRSFYGNFGMVVRALAYILAHGGEGLTQVSEHAVLTANYLMAHLRRLWDLPYDRFCMHEFVLSGKRLKQETGVRTLDVAKRLMDYGIHPPTVYFPLIVDECLMVEPTETEPKQVLDNFIAVMQEIHAEAHSDPARLQQAPFTTPVGRLDEARAARRPDLRFRRADSQ